MDKNTDKDKKACNSEGKLHIFWATKQEAFSTKKSLAVDFNVYNATRYSWFITFLDKQMKIRRKEYRELFSLWDYRPNMNLEDSLFDKTLNQKGFLWFLPSFLVCNHIKQSYGEQTKGCWRREEASHHTSLMPAGISVREWYLSPTILSLQFASRTAGETVTSSIGPETGGGHIATDINKRLHLSYNRGPV